MSKRALWLSDIHLNFLEEHEQMAFFRGVQAEEPDLVLIGGDIGEARTVEDYLLMAEAILQRPIYFVLGNHDYFDSSIAKVRDRLADVAGRSRHLVYMPRAGVVKITPNACLIGHGLWADGRLGDYDQSRVELNDYYHIDEFKGLDRYRRREKLAMLGDEAAAYLRETLAAAVETYHRTVVLTHVPPFREACWQRGRISDDDWLPHFACKAAGDVLYEITSEWPHRQATVLCGHTHGSGETRPLDNLHILTADAEYGRPILQRIIELE